MVTGEAMTTGRPLIVGDAAGPLLRLTHPISFWGGVDPVTGTIVDPRHPQFGASIAGVVLAVPSAVGSSSSSAIMLELLREGSAPAAIVIGEADAILALGVVIGVELGYPSMPIVEADVGVLDGQEDGRMVAIAKDGRISLPGPVD